MQLQLLLRVVGFCFSFSLQVQCEYDAADLKRAADLRPLHEVTNPPLVAALGTIRVQMRIATGRRMLSTCFTARYQTTLMFTSVLTSVCRFVSTDESFKSFFAEDQLPLALPLRETAYVEVSIARPTPDPTLSLRVRDCFAYPASRRSVWMLLYDGYGGDDY